ncbi:hypothetical protein ACL02O_23745 [Micromonospora sp. MS34]|uniref:hypothetical protein n=1 Tax=Micromonospora sp. MS34 TaxID=3385971 RepID=UPI00399F39A3
MSRRAVVVMVDADRARWLGACATHVSEQGYELAAIADAATALTMVAEGRADVIVAGTGSHLPSVEFAAGPLRPARMSRDVSDVARPTPAPQRRAQRVTR